MQNKGGKTNKFDSAFEKYSALLSKDYKDQFKKPDYASEAKKQKVKDAVRKGNAVVVSKHGGNKQGKNVDIAKEMNSDEVKVKITPKEIATQVQQARTKAEKTQDELAKMVEVKLHAIKDLENAEGPYDANLVLKIEKALKVTFTRSWKK